MNNAIMRAQSYAVDIEHVMRKVLNVRDLVFQEL